LPSSLSDGYIDSRDIEALRNQKALGEWTEHGGLELQQLRQSSARVHLLLVPIYLRRVFRPAGTPDDSALSAGRAMTALHVLQDELPWACCERVGEGREAGVVAEVLFVGSFS